MKVNINLIIGIIMISVIATPIIADLINPSVPDYTLDKSVYFTDDKTTYEFDWGYMNIKLYYCNPNLFSISKDFNMKENCNWIEVNNADISSIGNSIKIQSDARYIISKDSDFRDVYDKPLGIFKYEVIAYTDSNYLNNSENIEVLPNEKRDENNSIIYQYPIVYTYHENPLNIEYNNQLSLKDKEKGRAINYEELRHQIDFEDICSTDNKTYYPLCNWDWFKNSVNIYFLSDGNIDPLGSPITACATLSVDSYLNGNINNAPNTCFLLKDNVDLDLNGNYVDGNNVGNAFQTSGDYIQIWDSAGGSYAQQFDFGVRSYITTFDHLNVHDFEIKDMDNDCINLNSLDNFEITNMKISNCDGNAIYLQDLSTGLISNVKGYGGLDAGTPSGQGNGIQFLRANNIIIRHSLFDSSRDYGAYIIGSSNNRFENSSFIGASGITDAGVLLSSFAGTASNNNYFYNSTFESANLDFWIESYNGNTINNTLENCTLKDGGLKATDGGYNYELKLKYTDYKP